MVIMEKSKIAVIAVDQGYGNIKTANTVTPTGIIAFDTEPVFSGNILEYKGKYYRIGEGHKEFIADKSEDEDFYLLTLMAVARELKQKGMTSADVYLAVGLPLTWVRAQRDSFRKYLLRNEKVEFRFNGIDYRVRFVGCSVLPQGYPALCTMLNQTEGENILADIGNGTMNVLYIVDKKPVETKAWTEKYGVNQCVIAARNAVMDKYGVKVNDTVIERVLRTNKADIGQKYLACIREAAGKYVEGLFEVLRRYEYNPEIMKLFITGGGGCLVRNFGRYDADRVVFVNDICAAAKGYEYLTAMVLRKKENA